MRTEIRMGDTRMPYVAAADGALRAAGLWDDETWMLLGLTGLGFHLVVDRGTCPSSPTAYDWTRAHADAMRRIGVSSRCVECFDTSRFEGARHEAVAMIKASLDRGVPAVIRTFDYAEFAVVTGYDDGDGVFHVVDITRDPDPILYENLGRPHGSPFLFAQVFDERGEVDLHEAVRSSLRYAVTCWRGDGFPTSPIYDYRVGADGYRALIDAVERADTDPLGLRYILAILADARSGIARFTAQIAEIDGVPDVAATYARVAGRTARAAELLPAEPPFERPLERGAIREAVSVLREAAELEEQAVASIERGLDR